MYGGKFWQRGDVRKFGEWPWVCQIWGTTMNSPNLHQPNFLAILKLSRDKNFDCASIGIHHCQFWSTSSMHPHINSSPSNRLVHKLLYSWYPVPLNSTKTFRFFAVFTTFDTINLDVKMFTVLRNIFSRYFSLKQFHKFANFSFAKCVYVVNSPKFPTAKVSLHTAYSSIACI